MKTYKIELVRKKKEKETLICELDENLREVDRREMEGMGFTSRQGVEVSIYETCPVYVARDAASGRLVACWGLQVLQFQGENYNGEKKTSYRYIIWALGTNEINHHKKDFIKESTAIIKRWLELYGRLENTVATFNKKAVRWLKWMGAEFGQPYKMNGIEYVNFVITKKEE